MADRGKTSRDKTGSKRSEQLPITRLLQVAKREFERHKAPIIAKMAGRKRPPFEILVSTVLSLRTQDATTAAASARLFRRAKTPKSLLRLGSAEIGRLIYPVGFYNVKARQLTEIAQILIERHDGETPADMDALLRLRGVGRKTANLVLAKGFGIPGICVDTHVHRIVNRWGYVATRTPDQTELVLRRVLPKRYWIPINDWLVTFGQTVCRPLSPKCSSCPAESMCPKIGVGRRR
jgi:endonuclease-3